MTQTKREDNQKAYRNNKRWYFRRDMRNRGMSDSEIERAWAAWQTFDGVCQCCHTRCSKVYDTDHCHQTGRFRGIVGRSCNVALGWLEKIGSEVLLAYLKSH